ncbi:hypothetical protein HAL013_07450 [Helicobacter ailurogastricus]|uniref:Uncharacterized protein n=1 Tax=Helicobacter ailurogastricus TaxID=1578720 RepID=A0A0K2XH02_9HELI|nr:hypothetical protein HAL013_07450 [Helicobacter ailurogastricus]CRF44868.1 hypothetical protein HAL09_14860 [Helicobacter ailurogastricus]
MMTCHFSSHLSPQHRALARPFMGCWGQTRQSAASPLMGVVLICKLSNSARGTLSFCLICKSALSNFAFLQLLQYLSLAYMPLKSYLSQAILALLICPYALSKATFCNTSKYLSCSILPLKLISQAHTALKALISQSSKHRTSSSLCPPLTALKRLYLSALHFKGLYLSHQLKKPLKAISCPIAPQAPLAHKAIPKCETFKQISSEN